MGHVKRSSPRAPFQLPINRGFKPFSDEGYISPFAFSYQNASYERAQPFREPLTLLTFSASHTNECQCWASRSGANNLQVILRLQPGKGNWGSQFLVVEKTTAHLHHYWTALYQNLAGSTISIKRRTLSLWFRRNLNELQLRVWKLSKTLSTFRQWKLLFHKEWNVKALYYDPEIKNASLFNKYTGDDRNRCSLMPANKFHSIRNSKEHV